ncbi:MAG: hypothetical protein ACRD0G_04245 [Acidimicrobiales bacterium]
MEATPAWYTDALHAQAVEAAARGEGVALPAGALPLSAPLFTGIRPGMLIQTPEGMCTTNFVFGSPANFFIGTAGHCGNVGDSVDGIALTPGAPNPLILNIGSIVRSTGDAGIGNDFALIDVRPEMEQFVNPSMASWGGPTGVGDPQLLDPVVHIGYGVIVLGLVPRVGVVSSRSGSAYYWVGVAGPGDSGSAVREASGPAAGNLTHLSVDPANPGLIAGTTIDRMLALAGQPLATAPITPDPTS